MTAPANASVDNTGIGAIPSVAKTFVNRDTCQLVESHSAQGSTVQFGSAPFELNHTNLRLFYTAAGKYVYVVDGLRLEAPYTASPCSGVSRWCSFPRD